MSLTSNNSFKELISFFDIKISSETNNNNSKSSNLKLNIKKNVRGNYQRIFNATNTRNLMKNYSLYNINSKNNYERIFNSEKFKQEKIENNEKIRNKELKEIKNKKNSNYYYMNRADPFKEAEILYNFLQENKKKFGSNKTFNRTFSGFKNFLINDNNSKEKENKLNLKKFNLTFVRKGFFGKKNRDKIPTFFPSVTTYQNQYYSKSEKERHEKILNEFGKLKYFLYLYPQKKILIIKDFLIKYQINELEQYSKEEILRLEEFLKYFPLLIEPYKDIKTILKDILDNNVKINFDNKNKTYISPFYVGFSDRKEETNKKKIDYYDKYDLNKQNNLYLKGKNYYKNYQKIIDDVKKDVETNNKNNIPEKKEKFNFMTSVKKNNTNQFKMILSSAKNRIKKNKNKLLQKSKSQEQLLSEINHRLYYDRIKKPLDMEQIQKNKKVTEFAAYNLAKNNLFLNNFFKIN